MSETHKFTLELGDGRELEYEGLEQYRKLLKRASILIKRGQKFKVMDSTSNEDVTSSITTWKANVEDAGIRIRDCANRIIQTIPASTLPEGYDKPDFDAKAYVRAHHTYFLKKHNLS